MHEKFKVMVGTGSDMDYTVVAVTPKLAYGVKVLVPAASKQHYAIGWRVRGAETTPKIAIATGCAVANATPLNPGVLAATNVYSYGWERVDKKRCSTVRGMATPIHTLGSEKALKALREVMVPNMVDELLFSLKHAVDPVDIVMARDDLIQMVLQHVPTKAIPEEPSDGKMKNFNLGTLISPEVLNGAKDKDEGSTDEEEGKDD